MTEDQSLSFEAEVKNRLDQATSKTGYSFAGMFDLIEKQGAVKAAKLLVGPNNTGKLHEGFEFLVKHQLSHLSVEQVVIDFEDNGLFSSEDVSSAKARIAMAKMLFEKK